MKNNFTEAGSKATAFWTMFTIRLYFCLFKFLDNMNKTHVNEAEIQKIRSWPLLVGIFDLGIPCKSVCLNSGPILRALCFI